VLTGGRPGSRANRPRPRWCLCSSTRCGPPPTWSGSAAERPTRRHPARPSKTMTFVASLRQDGITPFVLDGPIAMPSRSTSPECSCRTSGIMDNPSSRKGPRVQELIEAAGAAPLPAALLQPDQNAFAKLKAMLRKAAERRRRPSAIGSVPSSTLSRPPNASATSSPLAMVQPGRIRLSGLLSCNASSRFHRTPAKESSRATSTTDPRGAEIYIER
jgi:hypothetical protein